MSDTLDWVCIQIGTKRDELLSTRQYRDLALKRKIVFAFFRMLNKSSTWIGSLLNRNHVTVLQALNTIQDKQHNRAVELVAKYKREIEGRDIGELKVERIVKTVRKKVPDYLHSCVVEKDVEVEDGFKISLPPEMN